MTGESEGGAPRPAREDRRVQRTRQLLRQALMALILEQGYEPITIQNILDRANLGRSTFYAHFRNKDELLMSGFQQFLEAFERHAGSVPAGGASLGSFSLAFFQHVAQMRRLLKALFGHHGSSVIVVRVEETLRSVLRHRLEALVRARTAPPAAGFVPLDMAAHFLTSSLMALVNPWLAQDLPYTAEEMDAMFKRLALPGLAGALGLDAANVGVAAP